MALYAIWKHSKWHQGCLLFFILNDRPIPNFISHYTATTHHNTGADKCKIDRNHVFFISTLHW